MTSGWVHVGQHELYTDGEAGALTEEGHGPMRAEVGETVRIYFANGGPNLTSALHPIGNVWARYYRDGDLLSEPGRNVETSAVAPGSVVAGEMELPVPGPVKIVDHALSRVVRKGMLGVIEVEGEPNPELYDDGT